MDDKEIAAKIKEIDKAGAESNKESAVNFKNHGCSNCDFVIDEAKLLGDAESFAELAHDWRCPSCGSEMGGKKQEGASHEAKE